ncbi:GNAT family N-acetyltransferase [Chryseolinea soli]|uniref:N-acetyltransferase n=1 Tax=Chryseolinea soli TaxID=2321403 RepID=A0A385SPV1_9BACT|nr:GNAT family N-acetyltransferase [Chryseolinea soli]AYB31530.1 N-acetyltransferase [Chryseolinea soli]
MQLRKKTLEAVRLNSAHKKKEFSCGEKALDDYLKTQAGQDQKRNVAVCFVLAEDDGTIKGYYTLASDNINRENIPEARRKAMPYKNLPVVLLGRLARDQRYKGTDIGHWLLVDALKQTMTISKTIGIMAVVVDPLHEKAAAFYEKFGFVKLRDTNRMFMAMETIRDAFKGDDKGEREKQ